MKQRRPVWLPNRYSRLFDFMWRHGVRRITVRGGVFVFLLFPLALYLYTEVFVSNAVIIDPFTVPRRYEDAGFTSEAMSRMIGDAINEIENKADSIMKKIVSHYRPTRVPCRRLKFPARIWAFGPLSTPPAKYSGVKLSVPAEELFCP